MTEKKSVQLTGNQLMQLAQQERQKLNEISQRANQFRNFKTELRAAKDTLEELSQNKKGDKIMINLGAGIYVNASIDNTETATTGLSGNIFKEKKITEITKTLAKKIESIDKTMVQVIEDQQKTISRLTQLENIISAGKQHMQKQQQ